MYFCFQVRLKRKIHFVEQMLNHLRQMREQKKILFLHNGAELYIAKAVRAFHMRKKLNKLIYWNRFVRAVTIQRMYRGYRARVRCTKLGKQKRKRAKLENESAVKVQAIVRSFIARCHFIRLLEKREERMQKLLDKKARYLMKVWSNITVPYPNAYQVTGKYFFNISSIYCQIYDISIIF